MSRSLTERFWEKVDRSGECWLWTATLGHGGRYGSISVDGRMTPAHRIAYELTIGPIPGGLELDHLCRVTRCVRPDHLEPVTHAENMRRGINARRTHCNRHGLPLVQTKAARHCRECRREDNEAYRRRRGARPRGEVNSWTNRTREQRAEISRRIWATRRRNAAA